MDLGREEDSMARGGGGSDLMTRRFSIVVERHPDGFVAYPLGLRGVVVGQGDTHEQAVADVTSAIRSHLDTFGEDVLDLESPVIEAFVEETLVQLE